jgi:hypothetical protein
MVPRVGGRLFVETADGRRLIATGGSVGVNFGRGRSDRPHERATRRDVERHIESMVGRDPDRWPSHLPWDQLSEVLDRAGVAMTEDELIATPFVLEFSDELLAELDH